MPDLNAVEPRPVVLIPLVEINRLLHAARVNAREPAQRYREVPVASRIIHRPENSAAALPPIAAAEAPAPSEPSAECRVGIHQPREGPFGFFLIIRRDWEIVVFKRRILAPHRLRGQQYGKQY